MGIADGSVGGAPPRHGGLWEINGAQPRRYRCHTGHGYTLRTLQHAQGESSDVAQLRAEGDHAGMARVEARMREMARQADLLRGLLEQVPEPYE